MYRNITDCSIQKHLIIRSADLDAYKSLASFHYRSTALGPFTHLFAIYDDHSRRRIMAPVVGVIVYRPPVPNLAIRNIVTGGFFSGLSRAVGLSLLNEHVRCISRVIIDPRYRGLGLASRLVKETMPLTGAAMVETSSVMGMVHPFFERAGMCRFRQPPDVKTERMQAALETVGIDRTLWIDTDRVHEQIESLDTPHRGFIEKQIQDFLQKFQSQRNLLHTLERTDFVLSKLGPPGHYYLWLNPEKPVPGLEIA
ncbi:MAG: hypothetical protein ISS71_00400 [Phycisphaerae bacterium]|nr:hypothetical protein [Phycisphaerae bacterium]